MSWLQRNFLVCVLLVAPMRLLAGGSYDARTEFSSTSNPNGVWTYGYYAPGSGTFVVYPTMLAAEGGMQFWSRGWVGPTYNPSVSFNPGTNALGNGNWPARRLGMHPGPSNEKSALRWVAPERGVAVLQARFQGTSLAGATTDVTFYHNNSALWTTAINGSGPASERVCERMIVVQPGDRLEFRLGFGSNGSYNSDSTQVEVTITLSSGRMIIVR